MKEVAERLGVSNHSLYAWIRQYCQPESERQATQDQAAEIRRLKAELCRVTDERDILKKAATYFAKHSGKGTRSSGTTNAPIPCAAFAG